VSRFLVTGAGGFIGRALAPRLRADGHEVIAPARQELDLLGVTAQEIRTWIGDHQPTHCIHTAWYTNHADYLTDNINSDWAGATVRLAEAFHSAGGQRFVGLGTCLEYDVRAATGPCREDATPRGDATLYARSKLKAFDALQAAGANFAWARIFFVYGPADRAVRLVPAMLAKFAAGEAAGPTFGGLRRDYIHVDDLAGQIVRIATADVRGAINTGTGDAPTLSEIYAAGAEAFGRPELAEANDAVGDQPLLIQADMSRFREYVGEPGARPIRQGLADLVG
jgi:nucleoside-diphosphate-sugar epimerase